MNKTKPRFGMMIGGAALALLVGTATGYAQQATAPRAAQQAVATPAAAPAPEAAPRAVFRPRDLMTPVERQAFRVALREAATPEARQQVRERLWVTLRQRAGEHGGVLAEPGQRVAQRDGAARRDAPPPRAP